MNPFLLDKKSYPDYQTVGAQVWDLDKIDDIVALTQDKTTGTTDKWYTIKASFRGASHSIAHFNDEAERDKVFYEIYQSMLEMKMKVKTEYYPS